MKNNKLYEAMQKGGLYDYISEHYYEIDKEDLASIIKELSYITYLKLGSDECNKLERDVRNSLVENSFVFEKD